MAKLKLRPIARSLRAQGESIKFIAGKLRISTSTASKWCKDVPLSAEQIAELGRRAHDPSYGKRLENSTRQRAEKEKRIRNLLKNGKAEVGIINRRDAFIAGVALYWAEGFKKDNLVGFSNSDPDMIKFFIFWLKRCFGYKNEDIKLRLGLNENSKERTEEIEQFWSDTTELSRNQFQKPFYQKVAWKKQYEHPENYHGVLRVRVAKSTDFLRKIYGFIEGLKSNIKESP